MSGLELHAIPRDLYYHEVAYVRGLEASKAELLAALKELLESYENQMHSEYDFPGSPWSAERDNDTEALNAMKAIAKAEGKST